MASKIPGVAQTV